MRRMGMGGLAALWLAATGCSAEATKPKWGVALDGLPLRAEQIAVVAQETGLQPALVVVFQQWPERTDQRDFPQATLDAIVASGAEPAITWEPMYYRAADGAETMVPAEAIWYVDSDRDC